MRMCPLQKRKRANARLLRARHPTAICHVRMQPRACLAIGMAAICELPRGLQHGEIARGSILSLCGLSQDHFDVRHHRRRPPPSGDEVTLQ
jgi:hypothetical protein